MEKIVNNGTNGTKRPEERRPAFGLFHANGRGTGSAMYVELRPATGLSNGYVAVHLAAQTGGESPYPAFGWDDAIEMRLGLVEVAEVLMVLRGYTESLRDGKGLFSRGRDGLKVLTLEHRVEPAPGYRLAMTRRADAESAPERVEFVLTVAEAFALCAALDGAMCRVAFGD